MTEILLRELSNVDLDWMVTAGQQKQLAAGDRLTVHESHDDPGSTPCLYILLDGELGIISPDAIAPSGQLIQGEILGGEALLDLPTPPSILQATAPSTAIAIPLQKLSSKLQDDTGFAARFYRALALILSEQLRRRYKQPATLRYGHQRETLQEALLVLGELRDSDIDWLTTTGHVRTIAPDDFLLQAGRPVDALHLILEGTFAVLWQDGDVNPLKVCFDCPIETAGKMQQITTLTKGEMAGTGAFLDFRPLSVTIRAQEEALVLSIPRQAVSARLQQDTGFSARFHRVLAIQLAKLLQAVTGMEAIANDEDGASAGTSLAMNQEAEAMDEELDLNALQQASQGAARFNWMLQRLGVS
ncbi:MAG: cyclic nucleotide-binding domain-containing protein [Elainellaceae cyanobacterium]